MQVTDVRAVIATGSGQFGLRGRLTLGGQSRPRICRRCRAFLSDHLNHDARNANSSGSSSTENNTGIISFVVTLPFKSLSTTTSC